MLERDSSQRERHDEFFDLGRFVRRDQVPIRQDPYQASRQPPRKVGTEELGLGMKPELFIGTRLEASLGDQERLPNAQAVIDVLLQLTTTLHQCHDGTDERVLLARLRLRLVRRKRGP